MAPEMKADACAQKRMPKLDPAPMDTYLAAKRAALVAHLESGDLRHDESD